MRSSGPAATRVAAATAVEGSSHRPPLTSGDGALTRRGGLQNNRRKCCSWIQMQTKSILSFRLMGKTRLMACGKVSDSDGCAKYSLNKRARYGTSQFHGLPHDIICGILSRLPFKEAVRTSLVCRQWRRLWRCYPNLVFTRETMLQGNMANNNPTHIVETFIGRVNSVVRQMKSASLRKLVVIFPLLRRDAHHIDRWVSLSVASRARRIIFYLCPETENIDSSDVYSFPLHLFSSGNCVKSLCLRFVSLTLPPGLSGFTNLKKLGLHMVSISGDLQSLLSQYDVLEWLSLTWCPVPHLIICQPLCRLRYLQVHHCSLQKLDLQAPNLTEFELTNSPIPVVLGECVNLSVAKIVLLSSSDCFDYVCAELPGTLYHVQDTLSINMTIRTELRGFAEGVVMFNNLKHLILNIDIEGGTDTSSGILRLASLLKLAPYLEELELNMYCHGPPLYIRRLDNSSLLCPHSRLKIVRMTGFYGIRGQLELALHILRSAKVLERLIIDPMIRVAWGPRIDWSVQSLMTMGRLMARLRLYKGDYGRVVTVL